MFHLYTICIQTSSVTHFAPPRQNFENATLTLPPKIWNSAPGVRSKIWDSAVGVRSKIWDVRLRRLFQNLMQRCLAQLRPFGGRQISKFVDFVMWAAWGCICAFAAFALDQDLPDFATASCHNLLAKTMSP